jgi:hypothetical protein
MLRRAGRPCAALGHRRRGRYAWFEPLKLLGKHDCEVEG